MFITSFGEQNITYKCCSNFLIHLSSEVNKELVQNWNISVTELFRLTTQYAIEQIQQQVENIQSTFREFATEPYRVCRRLFYL